MSKKQEPTQHTNPVGYGRPPVHSRFRKSQSGNPTGQRRHNGVERVNQAILREAYRLLTIRESDKITRKPGCRRARCHQVGPPPWCGCRAGRGPRSGPPSIRDRDGAGSWEPSQPPREPPRSSCRCTVAERNRTPDPNALALGGRDLVPHPFPDHFPFELGER
jgi:hypothetical protein